MAYHFWLAALMAVVALPRLVQLRLLMAAKEKQAIPNKLHAFVAMKAVRVAVAVCALIPITVPAAMTVTTEKAAILHQIMEEPDSNIQRVNLEKLVENSTLAVVAVDAIWLVIHLLLAPAEAVAAVAGHGLVALTHSHKRRRPVPLTLAAVAVVVPQEHGIAAFLPLPAVPV